METITMESLVASKTNPRKDFNKSELSELAGSIKEHGILQPILVRPVSGNGKPLYEIVAGERRYRASKMLGLTEIPVTVRQLSDAEAQEVQIIENLQRKDLHPLEEAEGYKNLLDSHGTNPDDLAVKVGKSKAYIYQRLKLLALSSEVKKCFRAGRISPVVALVLARIPHEDLQNQALLELLESCGNGDTPSYREALEHIERNYMTRLKDAPFDAKDATLIPKAGACADCPKRTGNEKILFPDIEREDICTDPLCFKAKKDAAWVKRANEAREKGWTVLEADEADKICRYGWIEQSSGYVDLNAVCQTDAKRRTWKRMLKKYIPPVTLIRNSREEVYELARVAELKEALEKAGYKFKKEEKTYERTTSRIDRKKIRIKREACVLATSALVTKLESYAYGDLVKLSVPLLIRTRGYNALWEVAKRRGLVETRKDDFQKAITKETARLDENGLKGLLIELLVSGDKWSTWSGFSQNFLDACKDAGVDLKKVESEAKRALEAKKRKGKKRKAKK